MGAADAVSIMTIHKSKGLEFPVCILGDCQKAYSDRSLRDDLIIAPESGIGIKNNKGRVKFDTLPRLAAKLETKRAERSEALRVLYVALTRARRSSLTRRCATAMSAPSAPSRPRRTARSTASS